jgi:hypothetical protein
MPNPSMARTLNRSGETCIIASRIDAKFNLRQNGLSYCSELGFVAEAGDLKFCETTQCMSKKRGDTARRLPHYGECQPTGQMVKLRLAHAPKLL